MKELLLKDQYGDKLRIAEFGGAVFIEINGSDTFEADLDKLQEIIKYLKKAKKYLVEEGKQ